MRRQAKSHILTTNGFPKKLSTDAGGGRRRGEHFRGVTKKAYPSFSRTYAGACA